MSGTVYTHVSLAQTEPHQGKISRAYVFRCLDCGNTASYEWDYTERFLPLAQAKQWAKRDGWSHTKDGWKCKKHSRRKNHG